MPSPAEGRPDGDLSRTAAARASQRDRNPRPQLELQITCLENAILLTKLY